MFLRRPASLAGHSACLCVVLAAVGCKSTAPKPDDAALTRTGQATINTDASLSGQPVTLTVLNGIANLNGSVSNDAQKTIAGRDIAAIQGVREVNNNLSIAPAPTVSSNTIAPMPATVPAPAAVIPEPARRLEKIPAPVRKSSAATPVPAPVPPSRPAPIERSPAPLQAQTIAPPPPPPAPAFRSVSVPSGTTIPVRVTQTLDSATTQEGDSFSGVVASDVVIDGSTVIPAGSSVSGHVDVVHEAGHFKGSSLLTVSLSGLTRRGERMQVSTDPYSVEGKGRGKNTAEKTGGGAAVGAILGGIFGGGKGAAIGAAAGGGVGAGSNAITRGEQVQIPSETVVRFHLAAPISVRVRTDGSATHTGDGLQPRSY